MSRRFLKYSMYGILLVVAIAVIVAKMPVVDYDGITRQLLERAKSGPSRGRVDIRVTELIDNSSLTAISKTESERQGFEPW